VRNGSAWKSGTSPPMGPSASRFGSNSSYNRGAAFGGSESGFRCEQAP
jgi:hypothetical protein